MKSLHFPNNIHALACSDFDETYFAHQYKHQESIIEMESLINALSYKGLLFGIVSASTREMIEECLAEGHYTYYPHFISTNSGTEIYYIQDGTWVLDEDYHAQFVNQQYDKAIILHIEEELNQQGINLITQEPFIHAPFSRNYYYPAVDETTDMHNIELIKQQAELHNYLVNISKCNPLIGDPEDHYDVDFFPISAGKHAVVQYLIKKFKIDHEHTFAFGDSGNDIRMLNAVKHGYLVNNATEEAKSLYSHVTLNQYNKGIHEVLSAHFKE